MTPPQAATPRTDAMPSLGRALGRVAAVGAVLLGLLYAVCHLDLVPAASRGAAQLGLGVAYALGLLGAAVKLMALRSTARPARGGAGAVEDGRRSAARLQAAVLGDFLLQLVAVGGGMFGMSLSGVKFPGLAGFGLAFATAALSMQVVAGLALARFSRRLPDPSTAGDRTPESLPNDAGATPAAASSDPLAALLRAADDPNPPARGSASR